MSTRWLRALATALTLTLVAAACGSDDKKSGTTTLSLGDGTNPGTDTTDSTTSLSETGQVSIWPLAFRQLSETEAEGVSSEVVVRMEPSTDEELRVSFSEEEVQGTGDQWRAAAWNAVTVGTILTGSPLSGKEFTFELSGRIDGPSAGALMTIAVISLLRGDTLKDDITMTGTINPDGTVGPVGGIPYKIDGAVSAEKARMLIPIGLRNSADLEGNLVDVVDAAGDKDVELSEVADIYEAYREFTDVDLPQPGDTGAARLSEKGYANIKAKVDDYLAQTESSLSEFNTLDVVITDALRTFAEQAVDARDRAADLEKQGLQAGAYGEAVQAAAFANAAVKAGRLVEIYLTRGVQPFLSQLNSSVQIDGRVDSLFQTLREFDPATVSDAAALMGAFGTAIDTLSLSGFADNVLANLENAPDETTALTIAAVGAVLKEVAGSGVDNAQDIFEVGRGLGGTELGEDANVDAAADFFRKAAEANLAAFDTVVLQPIADQSNQSLGTIKTNFAGNDFAYGLAQAAIPVLEGGLDEYLEDKAKGYAALGGAINLYASSAGLIAKYYSLGADLDENLNVTGIRNEQALTTAIDLAKDQVERAASLLTDKEVDPTLVVANYESAGVDREGDSSDKLSALNSYWTAFTLSRVLAYLGGFADEGMS